MKQQQQNIFQRPLILGDKEYILVQKIGTGGFSKIYEIQDIQTQQKFALKLIQEYQVYQSELNCYQYLIQQQTHKMNIPQLYKYGQLNIGSQTLYYLLLEKLGASLIEDLLCNEQYMSNSNNTYNILIQCLKQIECMHRLGYLHRDIKIDNYLLEDSRNDVTSQPKVFLIDFGFAQNINQQNQQQNQIQERQLVGNKHFMGLSYQSGNPYTYKDDLESWFYTMIYLQRQQLPWFNELKKSTIQIIREKLRNYMTEKICDGLPYQFKIIFQYIKKLQMNEMPNYKFIYDQLKAAQDMERMQSYCYRNQEIVINRQDNEHSIYSSSICNIDEINGSKSKNQNDQQKEQYHIQINNAILKEIVSKQNKNSNNNTKNQIPEISVNKKHFQSTSQRKDANQRMISKSSEQYKFQSCYELDFNEILEDLDEFNSKINSCSINQIIKNFHNHENYIKQIDIGIQ